MGRWSWDYQSCSIDYLSMVLQIKPVRDSMNEALQAWKKITGKGDAGSDDQKASHGKMLLVFPFFNDSSNSNLCFLPVIF